MFALRARPSASLAGYPALHAQSLPSCVACDSRAERDENRVPPPSTRRSLFVRSFAQERKLTPLLSTKRISSRPGPARQTIYLQLVADSLTTKKILTPTLPIPSTLFVRSFAQERKSTPFLSFDCERFCRNRGYLARPKTNPFPGNGFRGCYSGTAKKSEGLSNQP
jgi:hypothetical protein